MDALTLEQILQAYRIGLFPMAKSRHDEDVFWIDPDERGIFQFESFHIPKSLHKAIKKQDFTIKFNSDFLQTIDKCAEQHKSRPDTWINDEIKHIFLALHYEGLCHSVEFWQNNKMLGGLYGLAQAGVFFGESMFSRTSNASKICLVYLMSRLFRCGFRLVDAQFDNDHLKQFGLQTVTRDDFQLKLADALVYEGSFDTKETENLADIQSLLHFTTQTS